MLKHSTVVFAVLKYDSLPQCETRWLATFLGKLGSGEYVLQIRLPSRLDSRLRMTSWSFCTQHPRVTTQTSHNWNNGLRNARLTARFANRRSTISLNDVYGVRTDIINKQFHWPTCHLSWWPWPGEYMARAWFEDFTLVIKSKVVGWIFI